jgi:hypothetical protein
MAVEIPNGSVAVVSAQWSVQNNPFFGTADSFISMVQQELVFDGLTISNKQVGLDGLTYPLTGGFSPTLNILNQSGQELDDTDLINQLADAVTASGGTQIAAGVTQVFGSGTSQNTGTGSTQVTSVGAAQNSQQQQKSGVHQCGDPTWGFFDDPAQWLKCLTTGGLTTVGLLAIGLLAGVILFAYAKAPKIGPVPV